MMTDKQKRFAEEYLVDLNATRAAIRAGYSKKTAQRIGSENLSKPLIREYIEQKLGEMSKDAIASAEEVMEYLTSVMRRERKESVVVTMNKECSTYVPDEHGTMRKQTVKEEVAEVVEIPAKLSDANKAAELLGKRYSLFTDKIDVEGIKTVIFEGADDIED